MLTHLLQTAPAPGGAAGRPRRSSLPMIFIFVIFYFLLIAPMRKKQKKTQEMLSKLKKGDEVITGGGIFGRITALDEERGFVILQISDNTKIKVLRSAIAGLAGEPETTAITTGSLSRQFRVSGLDVSTGARQPATRSCRLRRSFWRGILGKKLRWRVLVILVVVLGAIAGYVATGYAHAKKEWTGPGAPALKDALKSAIKLGLDLRGGIHLVLQVNTADAAEGRARRRGRDRSRARPRTGRALGAVELPTDTSFIVAVTAQTDRRSSRRSPSASCPTGTYSTGRRQVDLRAEGRRAARRSRTTPSPRPSRRSATASTSSASPSR